VTVVNSHRVEHFIVGMLVLCYCYMVAEAEAAVAQWCTSNSHHVTARITKLVKAVRPKLFSVMYSLRPGLGL